MSTHGLQVFRVGALAAAVSVVIAAPAFAQGDDSLRPTSDPNVMVAPNGTLSTQVQYDVNDLSSHTGAHKVYRRLQKAAETVCGDDGSFTHDPILRRNIDQCEKSAVEDAVARVNSPKLTAVHE
jgi:UrcA family protein